MGPLALGLLAPAALWLPGACGRAGAERWVRLAEHYRPAAAEPGARPFSPDPGWPGARLRADPDGRGWWAEFPLAPEAWEASAVPGVLQAPWPLESRGLPGPEAPPYRLEVEGQTTREVVWQVAAMDLDSARPGDFAVAGDRILWFPGPLETLPPALAAAFFARGAREQGVWRLRLPGLAAEGWMLASGEPAAVVAPLPADSSLRLAVAAYPAQDGAGVRAPLELTVRLEGRELLCHPLGSTREPHADLERLEVALPPEARRAARFEFLLSGGPGFAALASPVLGPATAPPPAERSDRRPDLAIFLADTLRADALEVYRGRPGGPPLQVAPALDRFAGEATVFRQAFAPSPWTLPSHASMFTGLTPEQHGALRVSSRLPADLVTVPELLRAAGYRVEASTDGGFLSHTFQMDQGFELHAESEAAFDNQPIAAERLLAFARGSLAADDGRPLFLFAHTYRVHTPFLVTAETQRRLAALGSFALDFESLAAEEDERSRRPGAAEDARLAELRAQLERLYWGGVGDLDACFAKFLALLEERDFFARGTLIVTSDHGEAFGEHGSMYHASGLDDAQTRIPLLMRGPRSRPGPVDGAVSLTDVAATLADLANVTLVHPGPARSLLAPRPGRAIFQHNQPHDEQLRAAVEWPRRTTWDGESSPRVTDLEADPRELDPSRPSSPVELARAQALQRQAQAWVERFRAAPERAELTGRAEFQLRQLGYLGD